MRFLDTNILIYAQQDHAKARIAREILSAGGVISVQVLNEFTNVARKKLNLPWPDVEQALEDIVFLLPHPRAITRATHVAAVAISRDAGYNFHDALILASAKEAGCDTLLTEDMQDGRVFGALIIRNPFQDAPMVTPTPGRK